MQIQVNLAEAQSEQTGKTAAGRRSRRREWLDVPYDKTRKDKLELVSNRINLNFLS